MPNDLLKSRVRGRVRFDFFHDGALWYKCEDDWSFPVDVSETTNTQGASPTFLAEDKGIVFMRWIRKHMNYEDSLVEMQREEEAENTKDRSVF